MNQETGELRALTNEDLELLKNGTWKEVDMKNATKKQKKEMQVSKYDNKSELGKVFTGSRRERRATERAFNKTQKKKS